MSNYVKIGLAIAAFVGAFVIFQVATTTSKPLTPQEKRDQLDKQVAELKKSLPQKVHPLVTWFDVEAGDDRIIYKYQVEASQSTIVGRKKQMQDELKKSSLVWAAKFMMPSDTKIEIKLYDEKKVYACKLELD